MKIALQSIAILSLGIFLFFSCSEEKSGKVTELIPDTIEVEKEAKPPTQSTDSLDLREKVNPAPPPPVPRPMPPDPRHRPRPPHDPIEPVYPIYPEPPPPQMPPETKPNDPVVDFPDVDPEYIGGAAAMRQFLQENIRFPEVDREMSSQGRVYLQFIVEKDGSLSDVRVARGVSKEFDAEAVRVVQSMPNWKPGEMKGEVVRCRMRLPITFTLQ